LTNAFKTSLLAHRVKTALGLRSLFLDDVDPVEADQVLSKMLESRFIAAFNHQTECVDKGFSGSIISPAWWRTAVWFSDSIIFSPSWWRTAVWVKDNKFRIKTDVNPVTLLSKLREQGLCAAGHV
jgi:hypothetical protein